LKLEVERLGISCLPSEGQVLSSPTFSIASFDKASKNL
jgi:hypothetical protein